MALPSANSRVSSAQRVCMPLRAASCSCFRLASSRLNYVKALHQSLQPVQLTVSHRCCDNQTSPQNAPPHAQPLGSLLPNRWVQVPVAHTLLAAISCCLSRPSACCAVRRLVTSCSLADKRSSTSCRAAATCTCSTHRKVLDLGCRQQPSCKQALLTPSHDCPTANCLFGQPFLPGRGHPVCVTTCMAAATCRSILLTAGRQQASSTKWRHMCFQPSMQAGPTARHMYLVLISSTPSGTSPVVNGRLLSLAGAPAKQPAADMPARAQAADFSSCLSECWVQSPCMESRDAIPSTCRTLQPAMVKVAPSGFDTELHN